MIFVPYPEVLAYFKGKRGVLTVNTVPQSIAARLCRYSPPCTFQFRGRHYFAAGRIYRDAHNRPWIRALNASDFPTINLATPADLVKLELSLQRRIEGISSQYVWQRRLKKIRSYQFHNGGSQCHLPPAMVEWIIWAKREQVKDFKVILPHDLYRYLRDSLYYL